MPFCGERAVPGPDRTAPDAMRSLKSHTAGVVSMLSALLVPS